VGANDGSQLRSAGLSFLLRKVGAANVPSEVAWLITLGRLRMENLLVKTNCRQSPFAGRAALGAHAEHATIGCGVCTSVFDGG
jgi:hypothetical protein